MNDVQVALDNSIEGYFARMVPIIYEQKENSSSNSEINALSYSGFKEMKGDTSLAELLSTKKYLSDSSLKRNGFPASKGLVRSITLTRGSFDSAQRRLGNLMEFTTKIAFSMTEDSLNLKILTKYLDEELSRKKIDIGYAIVSRSRDGQVEQSREFSKNELQLSTVPKATYATSKTLEMYFQNASLIILKRGMVDLFISLLISVSVIGSLLYLYKIINQQKQLAEIKNDLISNITHEFKTPIATVTSALEGIANFNQQNDPEKTAKYLDMSNDQLKKLNLMVEKLLETATLDSDELSLRKEPVNLTQLLSAMIEKYKMLAGDKGLSFVAPSSDVIIEADPFHLENALSNLVDNAIKYGGSEVQVILAQLGSRAQVVVQDNGGFIEKSQKERVFDKFYRIPTGNQHDVKGFGIGLYYSRKIIEKHGGSIDLVLKPQLTSFEVAFS